MADGSESQSNSHNNTLLSSSSSASPPIPVLHSYTDTPTAYEEYMVHRINAIIGGLFTQPDYQTPYRFTFCLIFKNESELVDQQLMQQRHQQQLKKKKNRGNRKLQHFRRRCRAKGMNNHAIEMLTLVKKMNGSVHQNNQQIDKEKTDGSFIINAEMDIINMPISLKNQNRRNEYQYNDETLKMNSTNVSFILSQLISKEEWSSVPTKTCFKRSKRYNLSNDHWSQVSKLIPNYKKLSPYQFKDVLLQMIPRDFHDHTNEWLTHLIMLQFIQQRAELMCTVLQLQIEQTYWNYRSNLTNIPAVIWLLEAGEYVTKENFINWDHTKTKVNIQHRQTIIDNRLEQAKENLNIHFQTPYPFYYEIENKTCLIDFINVISNALVNLVENSLYYFRTNFEQKKILLNFDINDAHLVKSFYDLNPTEEQISSVQMIWRAKIKSSYNGKIDRDQQNQSLSIESFISSMHTIIETRLTNIEQRAQQLMKFIHTIDDSIFF
ncbi:unnamed protein product [Rotaria magnacalcarata]